MDLEGVSLTGPGHDVWGYGTQMVDHTSASFVESASSRAQVVQSAILLPLQQRRATSRSVQGMSSKAERAVGARAQCDRIRSAIALRLALDAHDGRPTALLFGARTCRTCRTLQPGMQHAAAKAGVRFLYVQHETSTYRIFKQYGVTATPTVLMYDASGELIDQAVYATSDLPRFEGALGMLAARQA